MNNYPPPSARANDERPLAESTAASPGSSTAASAPRKKPWSKPTILLVEDGVLLTESGGNIDPSNNLENEHYTLHS